MRSDILSRSDGGNASRGRSPSRLSAYALAATSSAGASATVSLQNRIDVLPGARRAAAQGFGQLLKHSTERIAVARALRLTCSRIARASRSPGVGKVAEWLAYRLQVTQTRIFAVMLSRVAADAHRTWLGHS